MDLPRAASDPTWIFDFRDAAYGERKEEERWRLDHRAQQEGRARVLHRAAHRAGLVLEGWEVKSLRAGRLQLKEGYVKILHGEAFLIGAHISALAAASTHVNPDPTRSRKLLLKRSEISRLIGQTERAGYTLVPTAMYWKRGKAKLEIGLAKGKKQHDKRDTEKDRDWQRDKERLFKTG